MFKKPKDESTDPGGIQGLDKKDYKAVKSYLKSSRDAKGLSEKQEKLLAELLLETMAKLNAVRLEEKSKLEAIEERQRHFLGRLDDIAFLRGATRGLGEHRLRDMTFLVRFRLSITKGARTRRQRYDEEKTEVEKWVVERRREIILEFNRRRKMFAQENSQ